MFFLRCELPSSLLPRCPPSLVLSHLLLLFTLPPRLLELSPALLLARGYRIFSRDLDLSLERDLRLRRVTLSFTTNRSLDESLKFGLLSTHNLLSSSRRLRPIERVRDRSIEARLLGEILSWALRPRGAALGFLLWTPLTLGDNSLLVL